MHQNRAVENVREAQMYWQSGDRRTDRQATNRQATSVLATGDLGIKLDLTVFVKFHSRVSLSSYRMSTKTGL